MFQYNIRRLLDGLKLKTELNARYSFNRSA
jgi:hypothetical protein